MGSMQANSLAEIEKRYAYTAQRIKEKNKTKFPVCSRLDQIRTVREFLDVIVECANGCDNYDFIYYITKLEERFGGETTVSLWEILNNYMLLEEAESEEPTHSSDIAFAALYNLVHHYYRAHDEARLAELCGWETNYLGTFFKKKYYLTVELFARYMAIIRHYDTQYRMSLLLHKYVERGILPKSAALSASFVSSVCALCNKKFEIENRSRFLPRNGARVRLDDALFMRELKSVPGIRSRQNTRKKPYNLNFEVVADWGATLEKALRLIDEAIVFNPSYAKYHYLKAQVMFYSHLLSLSAEEENGGDDEEVYRTVFKELIKAEDRENPGAADYETRIATYKNFEGIVNEYRIKRLGNRQDTRGFSGYEGIFKADIVPPPQYRPPITIEKENYLFISYSTKDFKPVYRDIIELQSRNVCLWYDVNTVVGEEWDSIVKEKIRHCDGFVCYISKNSMLSGAVVKELKLAREYNKPVFGVSLTKERIPKIIGEIGGNISTEDIRVFSELFDDRKKVIVRDPDHNSIDHIPVFISLLEEKFPGVIERIDVETLCRKNTLAYKPNEDFCLADEKDHIYVVADGISRNHSEYDGQNGSIAARVSGEFCKQFVGEFKRKMAARVTGPERRAFIYRSFKEAVAKANGKVKELIDREWDGKNEKPGCVAVAAAISGRTLYFGSVGDCVGILVRNNRKIIFAGKQTRYAFDYLRLEKDRGRLKESFVNHTENKYGYGVINGEESAVDYLSLSHLALEAGDTIYLLSDGLSNFVEFAESRFFEGMNVEELERAALADAAELRKNDPSARSYDDDRTVIKISVSC